jgi:hypothetical protein
VQYLYAFLPVVLDQRTCRTDGQRYHARPLKFVAATEYRSVLVTQLLRSLCV